MATQKKPAVEKSKAGLSTKALAKASANTPAKKPAHPASKAPAKTAAEASAKSIAKSPAKAAIKLTPLPLSETSLEGAFPIVGIGASAGGLAAFEAFFSAWPDGGAKGVGSGMAFVVVQHLAPDYKSLLSELIARYTRMTVYEIQNGMAVEPNCTYVIPPNHDLALHNGVLELLEPEPCGVTAARSISFFARLPKISALARSVSYFPAPAPMVARAYVQSRARAAW